jgi:hypothetical protein
VNSIRQIRSKMDGFGGRITLNQLPGPKGVHLVRTPEVGKSACGTPEAEQGPSAEFALALIHGKWKIPILLRLEQGPGATRSTEEASSPGFEEGAHPASTRHGNERSDCPD